MGLCYASDPETKESDITIHRLCLQSKDEISMYFVPGARHLGVFREKAETMGKPLPISISVGVDPAIEIAACFEPPTTPLGYNELGAAGGIRGQAVELVPCLTIDEKCIANAEYVIEGELIPIPGVRCPMPEGAFYAWVYFDIKGMNSSEMSSVPRKRLIHSGSRRI